MNKSKSSKKALSLLLAVAMLFTTVFSGNNAIESHAEETAKTVAAWEFSGETTLPASATTGNGSLDLSGSAEFTGYSSNALTAKGWVVGDYWKISVDATGYENLTFSVKQCSSGTGPAYFQLQYSTDGDNWTSVGSEVTLTKSLVLSYNNESLPSELNDKSFDLRLVVTQNVSVGNAEIAAGGTSNINNIEIKGTAISSGDNNEGESGDGEDNGEEGSKPTDPSEPTEPSEPDDRVEIQSGTYVIYNPANKKALSSVYNGYYNTGVDMTLNGEGKFDSVASTEVWTVTVLEDKTIRISQGEDVLSMDDSHASMSMNASNDSWSLKDAGNGLVYIKNTNRNVFMEWYSKYSNFTTYGTIYDDSIDCFAMQFVPATASSETEPTEPSEPDEPTESTELKSGTYVIYNPANKKALSSVYNGYYNTGVDMTLNSEGKFDSVAATEVWTVTVLEDKTIRISQGEDVLSMDVSFASTPLNKANDIWSLEDAGDGLYYIKNVGRDTYLEWYASKSNFSTYNTISEENKGLFAMQFVPATASSETEPSEPDEPTESTELKSGTYVIYNPANKKALSSVYNGFYNTGVDMTLNSEGKFDSVANTEVWTVTVLEDKTIRISQGEDVLSMDDSYSSTPLNKVNDIWSLEDAGDGLYYIKNVGRNTYLEWYASKSNFSTYATISDANKDLFAMQFVPATATEEKPPVTPVEGELADGTYFIYSASAEGVMAYEMVGGSAGKVSATINSDKSAVTFGDDNGKGAAVLNITKNSDNTYVIKCGNKYLAANEKEELFLASSEVSSASEDTHWIIEANNSLGGYTIKSSQVKYKSNDVYMEFYSSKGFCLYTAKSLSEIYAFSFPSAEGVENDNGYVGTLPAASNLPEDGKTYVIYNESGKSIIGAPLEGSVGSAKSLSAVVSSVNGNDITAGNGGTIFTAKKVDDTKYWTFECNGKYLATNNDEELLLQSNVDGNSQWELIEVLGGFLIKSKSAAWTSSSGNSYPIYIEYFSGAFSGYSYKATSKDIFTFNFYEVEDQYHLGYVVAPNVKFEDTPDANWEVDYTVSFVLDDMGTIQSTKVDVTYEDNSKKSYTCTLDGYNGTVVIPGEDLTGHTKASVKVSVVSQETESLKLDYDGTLEVNIKDEPVITAVAPAPNSKTGNNKKPAIKVSYANIGEEAAFTLTVNDSKMAGVKQDKAAKTFTYTPSTDMEDGKYVVTAVITRKDGKSVEKTWNFQVGAEGVSLYFGQIHSHTAQYSDGSGTLANAYEYAMNKAADLDYLIVTDHSNYFDTTKSATKESIFDDAAESLTKSSTRGADGNYLTLWQEAKQTAAEYDAKSEDFVSAYGYEMTWSGGPGHLNVFNTLGIASRNNSELNNKTNNAGMLAFYDLLVEAQQKNKTYVENAGISAQFNHPGTTFGFFDSFTGWTLNRDEVISLIEVGNGDGAIGSSAYFPSYEYYDMCLSAGWHVAPTNGQDNHKGRWGDANTARTVTLAENFTEAGIYDAMSQRHVYSTEDQNLSVLYYLNETLQGGIIDNFEGENVEISVSLSDKDNENLGKVYVIGLNGKILHESEALTGNTADLQITLKNSSPYYYIKVVQKDGDIAVTAPVWVGSVKEEKASVSTALTNASAEKNANSVEGQEEKLTVSLTNEETSEITLVSYSVAADGKTIASETVNKKLAGGEKASYDISWTPEKYGTKKVVASFVYKVNDSTQTVTVSKNIYVEGKDYNKVSDIKSVRAGAEGQEFTVEAIVTANTSGYDKNTAFFDCTYVQDGTAGINVFPVSDSLKAGQKVRLHGAITYYNGEMELNISEEFGGYLKVIDENVNPVEPKKVSTKDAMEEENIGMLMNVTGKVTRVHEASGVIDRIYINDGSGDACIYINGYIWNSSTQANDFGTTGSTIKVGDFVSAIGIGSVDVDELGEVDCLHRLRVRDRAEINLISDPSMGGNNPGDDNPGDNNPGDNNPGGNNSGNNNQGSDNTGSDNTGSNNTSSNNTGSNESASNMSTTDTKNEASGEKIVSIEMEVTPLASNPASDVTLVEMKLGADKLLRRQSIAQFFGTKAILFTHLGNLVGFSINANQLVSADVDLSTTRQALPLFAEGFMTYALIPKKEVNLSFELGMHVHVGIEYVGKKAYIFQKNLVTGQFDLVSSVDVNEIGNVALFTSKLSQVMVLVQK